MRILAPVAFTLLALTLALGTSAADLPVLDKIDFQPFAAQITRLIDALDYLGSPLSASDKAAVRSLIDQPDPRGAAKLQEILDRYCLFGVNINPEMRVKVAQGPVKPELVEQGWREFLVKVHNEAGATSELRVVSPNAQSVSDSPSRKTRSDTFYRKRNDDSPLAPAADLWLDLDMFNRQPLKKELS